MARIGVQAMMLKNEFEADVAFTTLKSLNELGYNVVEISQISMSEANVGEIERARAELGMEIAWLTSSLFLSRSLCRC
jgi:4-hydroxy-3-methylbut-2-en-1-yl diphosphate synthase IspG/GcpE